MTSGAKWRVWRGTLACALFVLLLPVEAAAGGQAASHGPVSAERRTPAPSDRVDLNQASLDDLLKVPGMTHSWAERIVRYRPYRTKRDLLDHGILSPVVYARIKEFVIVHREAQ